MFTVSVTVQNGTQVMARLEQLANACRVIGGARIKIGTDDVVGKFVEEGTRAHAIYPRDKKALAWPGGRHPVKVVHHPGTTANPFLERAMSSTRGAVDHYVASQLEMVASGGGSNYSQIMPGAAKIVLEAARQEAPVGPDTPTRKGGSLRRSLYIVN